jgi:hypothetical protein
MKRPKGHRYGNNIEVGDFVYIRNSNQGGKVTDITDGTVTIKNTFHTVTPEFKEAIGDVILAKTLYIHKIRAYIKSKDAGWNDLVSDHIALDKFRKTK